ncbi:MAG: hypothetical protein ACIPMY_00370 [Rickettsia endosymbiont of Pentastiridius leporinus]
MSKQKVPIIIPTLNLPTKECELEGLANSEEDRIVLTPTPPPAFSDYIYSNNNIDLDSLEYFKNLKKNDLKSCFIYNTPNNQNIFCQAVEQNEIILVKNILKIQPLLINLKTVLEGHNILHKALMGLLRDERVAGIIKK